MNKIRLRQELVSLADFKYCAFSRSLLPGAENILGVRLPYLRQIAKYAANNNWRDLLDDPAETLYMEEQMVLGMILGYAKDMEWEEFLFRIAQFIPKIDNWSICDSVCCTLKRVKTSRKSFWNFLLPYLFSPKEFDVRFAAVMILNFYIDEEWIDRALSVLVPQNPQGYYAKMGIAWALSVCWISFPEKAHSIICPDNMAPEIYQKTIQKVIESAKTPKLEKERLRLERKNFIISQQT